MSRPIANVGRQPRVSALRDDAGWRVDRETAELDTPYRYYPSLNVRAPDGIFGSGETFRRWPFLSQRTSAESTIVFGRQRGGIIIVRTKQKMNTLTVYVETTVIGHIAARQQSDIVVAARQLSSQRWWTARDGYELVVSQIVVDECSAGDTWAASERLELIAGIPILAVSPEAEHLAEHLILGNGVPASEPRDALHISIAAVNGIRYLVTWNFRHIANAETRVVIEQICRDNGYVPPLICTPDELMGA